METKDISQLEEELIQTRSHLSTERLDMSFGEIMNIYQDGDIIINPDFQRLFRWSDEQKTRFIESILLGIPIPPIFVSEDECGKWELVDGLQRLSTILSFFGLLKKSTGELDEEKNNWAFTQGEIIHSLEGKKRQDLSLKLQLYIKRAVCRVELLRYDSKNTDLKYELFNRLNTGGATATEQEIRNCIFRGIDDRFNKFLKDLAKSQTLFNLVMPSKEEIEKLYLEELVLRFVCLYYAKKEELIDNISKSMTNFMKKNVSNPTFDFTEAKNLFERLFNLLDRLQDYKVFRGDKGPFSTNLFDIITIGVAHNIEFYEAKPIETLRNKIKSLKESELSKKTTSGKVSSKERNIKRIELGKSFFNPNE